MFKVLAAIEDLYFVEEMEKFLLRLQFAPKTEIKLLHVIEPMEAISAWPNEQYRKDADELLATVGRHFTLLFPNIQINAHLAEGYAREVIIDTARSWGANMIIVGSHGRQGLNKLILGSVSTAVVSFASCPVVVIRNARTGVKEHPIAQDAHDVGTKMTDRKMSVMSNASVI